MLKYYYTDPLKAAWMAREFGIKVYQLHTNGKEIRYGLFSIIREYEAEYYKSTYYIYPDCYEMLKPQVGDMIQMGNEPPYILEKKLEDMYIDYHFSRNPSYNEFSGIGKIIQRDGKAFFMPEVEE